MTTAEGSNPSGAGKEAFVKNEHFYEFQKNYYAIMGGLVVVMGIGFINLLVTVQGLVLESNDEKISRVRNLEEKVDALILRTRLQGEEINPTTPPLSQ